MLKGFGWLGVAILGFSLVGCSDQANEENNNTALIQEQAKIVEQLPNLSKSELGQYLTESSTTVDGLARELLNRYKESRKTGDYHSFNRWRVNDWAPRVEQLSQRYNDIVDSHGKQIRFTDLMPIFSTPKELLLASLKLIWKPSDKDISKNFEDTKKALIKIGDGYKRAEAYLTTL
jgi:hypothetical protein